MRRLAPLAALVLAAVVAAQENPPVPEDLARLREQAAGLERHLRDLEQRQTDLGAQRERLEGELRLAELRVRESESERRVLEAAEKLAAEAVAATQRQLEAAVDRLRSEITLLAILGRAGLAPLVLRATIGGEDLARRVTVTLALARDQKRRRDEIVALGDQRAKALAALSQRREELVSAGRRIEERRAQLVATRRRVVAELARLEQDRRTSAVALADAREAETRLERLWGVVAGKASAGGEDIHLLRGGLPWPVADGAVVRSFGPHRDPAYGTVTVSHGLALSAAAGERVRAIAGGKVAYAQFFKGYGNLVIVQHGGQVYSLYARLAAMLTSAGQSVAMGDPVGLTPPPEGDDGNVYLEIRVGQEAQDPLQWLKPAKK